VYGYSSVCDLSFVTRIRNVRHFAADCLREAINVGCLAALENLETLSVAIYDLQSFAVLADISWTNYASFFGSNQVEQASTQPPCAISLPEDVVPGSSTERH
jgi:hypothetical protein